MAIQRLAPGCVATHRNARRAGRSGQQLPGAEIGSGDNGGSARNLPGFDYRHLTAGDLHRHRRIQVQAGLHVKLVRIASMLIHLSFSSCTPDVPDPRKPPLDHRHDIDMTICTLHHPPRVVACPQSQPSWLLRECSTLRRLKQTAALRPLRSQPRSNAHGQSRRARRSGTVVRGGRRLRCTYAPAYDSFLTEGINSASRFDETERVRYALAEPPTSGL